MLKSRSKTKTEKGTLEGSTRTQMITQSDYSVFNKLS